MKMYKHIFYVLLILAMVSPAFADPILSPWACNDYTIIQLGDPPEQNSLQDDDTLNIESNSSVFGSVLKGVDTKEGSEFKTMLSTSKVTDRWDVETEITTDPVTGVTRDKTASAVIAAGGSENEIGTVQMDQIRADALAASTFWAGESATNLTAADHAALDGGGGLTLNGTTGGANVFNSTKDFLVNGTILELTGGVGDFFVFNISERDAFLINSGAEIKLSGDITPEEVLFNVLGSVGGGFFDDAQIQGNSLFRGTLLTPGRNVIVSQNHFDTFDSSGLLDDDGTFQAPETTLIDWQTATEGLFGQIVAGGKISWSESDIAHHGFCLDCPEPVPEPGTIALLSIGIVGLAGAEVRRRRKKKAVD